MRKLIAVLVGLMVLQGVAEAGGRARIVGLQAPREVTAGRTFQLSFGVQPIFPVRHRNIEPVLTATAGGRTLTFPVTSARGKDRFAAAVALPDPGEWSIHVDSRYCQTFMAPVTIRAVAIKS
jgi:hypothetical protein